MKTYPSELQLHPQWVIWRVEQRKGKTTKIPVNPYTGANARSTDPATWGTFAEALAGMKQHHCHGVGFVFTNVDPYCGVDLDKCLDPATGELSALARQIVTRLASYTASSVSGTGLHIIVRATLPPGRRQGAWGGLYDSGRFFALTGKLWPGSPTTIAARQAEIEALHRELFPPQEGTQPRPVAQFVCLNDREILDKMFAARNSTEVRRLWDGDTSTYPSHSEADLALCSHLAFWCGGDVSRVDALFRQSGLYRERKWNREDYRQRTIAKALEQIRFYDPQRLQKTGSRAANRLGSIRTVDVREVSQWLG